MTPSYNGPAKLLKFSPGASGNVAPVQVVTGIAGMPPDLNFYADGLAVDSHDNVYTVAEWNRNAPTYPSAARAYALPPTANGVATRQSRATDSFRGRGPTATRQGESARRQRLGLPGRRLLPGGTTTPPSPTANPVGGGVVQFPAGSATPSRAFYGSCSLPDAPVLGISIRPRSTITATRTWPTSCSIRSRTLAATGASLPSVRRRTVTSRRCRTTWTKVIRTTSRYQ